MSRFNAARASARDAGFTLVEALVALSLVALIMLVVFVGLRLGSESWNRTEHRSQLAGEVSAAQRFVRQAIEQAYPGMAVRPGAPSIMTFRGAPEALELSAPIPRDLAVGGRHRLFLSHSSEQELTLAWVAERNQPPAGKPPVSSRQVTLLSGVSALSFAYFGQTAGEPQPRWHREWVDQRELPQLIRVEARLTDSARRWPTLDAAPRTDVDATCVLDPLTRACRGR